MFVLKPKTESFFYPVTVPVVTDAGVTQNFKFEMSFRRKTRTELAELQSRNAGQEGIEAATGAEALERDVDYILDIADGWRQVQDEAGQPVPFERDTIRSLIDTYPTAAGPIVGAFFEATLGGGKRKN